MLPPVSLPMAKPTRPAATAEPGPALEPDEPSSGSQGFIVWPPNQMSLRASAPRLSLATSTAPAERFSAVSGWDAGGIEQVFGSPWDAVKRASVAAGGDFFVGFLCLCQR